MRLLSTVLAPFCAPVAAPPGLIATGRAYVPKTTPHMFVVDPAGKFVYDGAIDDRRSSTLADARDARSDIRAALAQATAGRSVSVASTAPCRCSVKY